jgi:hypothetical protein
MNFIDKKERYFHCYIDEEGFPFYLLHEIVDEKWVTKKQYVSVESMFEFFKEGHVRVNINTEPAPQRWNQEKC